MLPANFYAIRPATMADAVSLRRLAVVSDSRPLTGRILVAEHQGIVVAALSRDEHRTIADSHFVPSYVATLLRLRAERIEAYEREPRLSERIREAVLGPRDNQLAKAA
jgi:hypothetical protein